MEKKICKLTGEESCPLKKMCLNCKDLIENTDGTFACGNAEIMESGRQKVLAAVPEGWEFENFTLKPMALKNPSKKCGNYQPNTQLISSVISEVFGEVFYAEANLIDNLGDLPEANVSNE